MPSSAARRQLARINFTHTPTQTHTHTHTHAVPYEGDSFANSKMDNFSLIIDWLNFLKNYWNFFMKTLNTEVYIKV